jgi:hypothetical protein
MMRGLVLSEPHTLIATLIHSVVMLRRVCLMLLMHGAVPSQRLHSATQN